ncbi:MAG: DUF1570 domain-containing protein [Thermoanaerobaculia bacterium]
MKAPAFLIAFATALVRVALAAPAAALPDDPEGWHAVRTPHFILYTDAAPERSYEIAASLARFRAVFAQLAPSLELISPAPTKMLAFRDAESYSPYKTDPDPRVLGQFLSHPDGNYLTLDAGARQVGSFAVIYHEYVHYFVRHNFPAVPRWFNEGLAEYYSTFAVEESRAVLGRPVERHVRWLRRHGNFSLSEVVQANRRWPEEHGGAGQRYAVSWALVHYLLSGSTQRLERTADYLLRLETGEDPERAFEEAFDLRLSTLEDELRDYVLGGDFPQAAIALERLPAPAIEAELMRPADVLFHLGDLLSHIRRSAEAESHFHAALDFDGEHPEAHAGLALVRDHHARLDEAEVLYRDAVRLGSTDPLTYLLYGRHLLRVGDRQAGRAREMLRRAVELDDGYGEGWALLGAAHLAADADPVRGIRSLQRARRLLPNRMDLVFYQAQLHARNAEPEPAHALVEGILALRADPELVDRARSEVERLNLLRAADDAFERQDSEEGLRLFDEAVSVTVDPALRQQMELQLLELQQLWTGTPAPSSSEP